HRGGHAVKSIHLTALAASIALLAGCTPEFDHLDFSAKTTPPEAVTIDYRSIEIPAGIAIGVSATPMAGTTELDAKTVVELRSEDATILGVDPSIEPRTFVVYGVEHGNTIVDVVIDGELRGTIPALVEPQ